LPSAIICEIAKYEPSSIMKLALTCKNFNGILQEDLKKIQKIAENNKKLEKVEWAIGNLLEVYSDKMEDEDELNYWYIMNNLNDNAQCVNCKQFRRDRIFSFYTRNDCHLCAYKMFNKTELELSHDFYEMNIIYCLR
jgi:hypothetical protein